MRADTIAAKATLTLALFAGALGFGSTPVGAEDVPRVRPTSRATRQLIEDGARQSPTLRDLIERISTTDVIVYVQVTGSPQVPTASTAFVASTPGRRYLRILINSRNSAWSRAQLLAHELQHVFEIASQGDVMSDDDVRNLYRRIGHTAGGVDRFETTAARRVEEIVRREIAGFGK